MDEFVLFAFLLFTANKSNSSVQFLGESTACQSAFRCYLTFKKFGSKVVNRQYIHRKTGLKRAKPAKNGTEERILTLRCQQKST